MFRVTIGKGGTPATMAEVARAADAELPLRVRADEVWLMEGTPDPPRWSIRHRFALGSA